MTTTDSTSLLAATEERRLLAAAGANASHRSRLGQFLTPPSVARFMASLFDLTDGPATLLDPGGGVGSLSAAFVDRWVEEPRGSLDVTAIELDAALIALLEQTIGECGAREVSAHVIHDDFLEWACDRTGLAFLSRPQFDYVIMNPPYRKIANESRERRLLSACGVEVTNLYAGFVSLALRLMKDGGQMVAITPRSFANGPYFREFRRDVLEYASFRRIHVYETRDTAFSDSDVLQENVIFRLVKGASKGIVTISSSRSPDDEVIRVHDVPHDDVVRPADPQKFVHLITDSDEASLAVCMGMLTTSLHDLGLDVSTGRVVDFRAKAHLRREPDDTTVPLIHPSHIRGARVCWPIEGGKKANALALNAETSPLTMPIGPYVVSKRFTAKEERRRQVSLRDPTPQRYLATSSLSRTT